MDLVLFGLVLLMVSVFLLAFYMDWLGLWVGKQPLKVPGARQSGSTKGQGSPR
jgi:hypothetical protein